MGVLINFLCWLDISGAVFTQNPQLDKRRVDIIKYHVAFCAKNYSSFGKMEAEGPSHSEKLSKAIASSVGFSMESLRNTMGGPAARLWDHVRPWFFLCPINYPCILPDIPRLGTLISMTRYTLSSLLAPFSDKNLLFGRCMTCDGRDRAFLIHQ